MEHLDILFALAIFLKFGASKNHVVRRSIPIHYHASPTYKYSYGVKDHATGDYKLQEEERIGDKVTGIYTVADPDGSLRTTRYTVDKTGGFKATVTTDKIVEYPHNHLELNSNIRSDLKTDSTGDNIVFTNKPGEIIQDKVQENYVTRGNEQNLDHLQPLNHVKDENINNAKYTITQTYHGMQPRYKQDAGIQKFQKLSGSSSLTPVTAGYKQDDNNHEFGKPITKQFELTDSISNSNTKYSNNYLGPPPKNYQLLNHINAPNEHQISKSIHGSGGISSYASINAVSPNVGQENYKLINLQIPQSNLRNLNYEIPDVALKSNSDHAAYQSVKDAPKLHIQTNSNSVVEATSTLSERNVNNNFNRQGMTDYHLQIAHENSRLQNQQSVNFNNQESWNNLEAQSSPANHDQQTYHSNLEGSMKTVPRNQAHAQFEEQKPKQLRTNAQSSHTDYIVNVQKFPQVQEENNPKTVYKGTNMQLNEYVLLPVVRHEQPRFSYERYNDLIRKQEEPVKTNPTEQSLQYKGTNMQLNEYIPLPGGKTERPRLSFERQNDLIRTQENIQSQAINTYSKGQYQPYLRSSQPSFLSYHPPSGHQEKGFANTLYSPSHPIKQVSQFSEGTELHSSSHPALKPYESENEFQNNNNPLHQTRNNLSSQKQKIYPINNIPSFTTYPTAYQVETEPIRLRPALNVDAHSTKIIRVEENPKLVQNENENYKTRTSHPYVRYPTQAHNEHKQLFEVKHASGNGVMHYKFHPKDANHQERERPRPNIAEGDNQERERIKPNIAQSEYANIYNFESNSYQKQEDQQNQGFLLEHRPRNQAIASSQLVNSEESLQLPKERPNLLQATSAQRQLPSSYNQKKAELLQHPRLTQGNIFPEHHIYSKFNQQQDEKPAYQFTQTRSPAQIYSKFPQQKLEPQTLQSSPNKNTFEQHIHQLISEENEAARQQAWKLAQNTGYAHPDSEENHRHQLKSREQLYVASESSQANNLKSQGDQQYPSGSHAYKNLYQIQPEMDELSLGFQRHASLSEPFHQAKTAETQGGISKFRQAKPEYVTSQDRTAPRLLEKYIIPQRKLEENNVNILSQQYHHAKTQEVPFVKNDQQVHNKEPIKMFKQNSPIGYHVQYANSFQSYSPALNGNLVESGSLNDVERIKYQTGSPQYSHQIHSAQLKASKSLHPTAETLLSPANIPLLRHVYDPNAYPVKYENTIPEQHRYLHNSPPSYQDVFDVRNLL